MVFDFLASSHPHAHALKLQKKHPTHDDDYITALLLESGLYAGVQHEDIETSRRDELVGLHMNLHSVYYIPKLYIGT